MDPGPYASGYALRLFPDDFSQGRLIAAFFDMPHIILSSLTGLGLPMRIHPGNKLPGYCLSSLTGLGGPKTGDAPACFRVSSNGLGFKLGQSLGASFPRFAWECIPGHFASVSRRAAADFKTAHRRFVGKKRVEGNQTILVWHVSDSKRLHFRDMGPELEALVTFSVPHKSAMSL